MATKKTTTAPVEQTEAVETTAPVTETAESAVAAPTPILWHATVCHCTGLRLRQSPHVYADTKEILPVGTEVAILNDAYCFVSDGCNVWFHVEVTETHETGFVCGAFLTPVVGE